MAETNRHHAAGSLAARILPRHSLWKSAGALGEPYIIDGHRIQMPLHRRCGLPGDGQTFDSLMKQADIAMYRAQGNWGTAHHYRTTPETRRQICFVRYNRCRENGSPAERDYRFVTRLRTQNGQRSEVLTAVARL